MKAASSAKHGTKWPKEARKKKEGRETSNNIYHYLSLRILTADHLSVSYLRLLPHSILFHCIWTMHTEKAKDETQTQEDHLISLIEYIFT